MVILARGVLPHLKDDGKESVSDPADGPVLLRGVGTLIEIIRMRKDLLRLFKTDTPPRILAQTRALARVKVEAHYSITVIPQEGGAVGRRFLGRIGI